MPKKKPPTREPVTFRLSTAIIALVDEVAIREGQTRSEYVERVVTRAVTDDAKRAA